MRAVVPRVFFRTQNGVKKLQIVFSHSFWGHRKISPLIGRFPPSYKISPPDPSTVWCVLHMSRPTLVPQPPVNFPTMRRQRTSHSGYNLRRPRWIQRIQTIRTWKRRKHVTFQRIQRIRRLRNNPPDFHRNSVSNRIIRKSGGWLLNLRILWIL